MNPLFLFLDEFGQRFINFVDVFKETTFGFINLLYCFVSMSLISSLIFMISFRLLIWGIVCSSFSSCFRCKVRLFIWAFSSFLRWDCIAINFPLRTAFAVSHRFWVVVSLLSFVSEYLLIFLFDFFSDPLVVQQHIV